MRVLSLKLQLKNKKYFFCKAEHFFILSPAPLLLILKYSYLPKTESHSGVATGRPSLFTQAC